MSGFIKIEQYLSALGKSGSVHVVMTTYNSLKVSIFPGFYLFTSTIMVSISVGDFPKVLSVRGIERIIRRTRFSTLEYYLKQKCN